MIKCLEKVLWYLAITETIEKKWVSTYLELGIDFNQFITIFENRSASIKLRDPLVFYLHKIVDSVINNRIQFIYV